MKTAQGVTLIANGRLVNGTGAAPVPDAAVVIKDGKITYAGPARGAPAVAPDVRRIDARGGTILPGLVEAHFHPTYFDVAVLADLDIKYPVEYVTILAACNARLRARMRLHRGPQRRQPAQYRRVAQEGDRGRPDPRPAPGRQRARDLWRGGTDGLEPRAPQARHGGPDPLDQRPR